MKSLLFVTFLFFIFGMEKVILAQSIQLVSPPGTVHGTPDQSYPLQATFGVKNVAASSIRVKAFRQIMSEVSGSQNNICWGPTCYPPTVDTSTNFQEIPAGVVDSTFIGDYEPQGNAGVTKIKYCFYDINNISDSVCTVVHFDAKAAVGVSELTTNNAFIKIYPNPASHAVVLDFQNPIYSDNAQITLYDIMGKSIKTIVLNKLNKNVLSVEDIKPGLYFYSLIVDGKIAEMDKLVINR